METENHEAASVLKKLLKMCVTHSSDFLLWKLGTLVWVFHWCYSTIQNYCEDRGISHWKALSGHVKNSFWRADSSKCAEVCCGEGKLGQDRWQDRKHQLSVSSWAGTYPAPAQQPRLCRKAPWQPGRALCDIPDEVQFIWQSFGCKKRAKKKALEYGEKIGLSCALGWKCFARGKGFRSRAATARAAAGGKCVTGARGELSMRGPVQLPAQIQTSFSPCPVAVPVWSLRVALRTGEKGDHVSCEGW